MRIVALVIVLTLAFLAGYATGPVPGPSIPTSPAPMPKKPMPSIPAPKTSTSETSSSKVSELQVTSAPALDIKKSLQAFLLKEWIKGGGEERWWVDRVEANLDRFARLEAAFMAVWSQAPLNQQKLALALCLVETGCGFGETRNWKLRNGEWSRGDRFWNTEVFLSRAGACGVTQVVPQVLGKNCAHANLSYYSAFALQKQWLMENWTESDGRTKVSLESEDWLHPVYMDGQTTYLPYRYNGGGSGAWRYGRRWKEAYDGLVLK